MHRIMFVCHGNICRSTMAEFLMKDLVKKNNKQNEYLIASSGTSSEELGNPVHYGTRKILNQSGIDCSGKYAVTLKKADYNKYDYFICMDQRNWGNMLRIFGTDKENKCYKLLDFTDFPRDVADPYWTGDFNETLFDVEQGVNDLYEFLEGKK